MWSRKSNIIPVNFFEIEFMHSIINSIVCPTIFKLKDASFLELGLTRAPGLASPAADRNY